MVTSSAAMSPYNPKRKSRLAFLLPLGVKGSEQPMYAETHENEERSEIREKRKDE
jgi:hypothetical protein